MFGITSLQQDTLDETKLPDKLQNNTIGPEPDNGLQNISRDAQSVNKTKSSRIERKLLSIA